MGSLTQKKSSSDATAERPSVRSKLDKPERSSVRKIEKAESVSKLPKADRVSVAKMASADRPSARKLERASKSDVNGASDVAKKERPSKADLSSTSPDAKKAKEPPPAKRSWRRELFRAMVDALRDILRAERRPS